MLVASDLYLLPRGALTVSLFVLKGVTYLKTIYMETTKISPEKTAAEIQNKLKDYGLTKFMFDYDKGDIVGCVFSIKISGKDVPIKLPVRWEPLWIMIKQGKTKYAKTIDQAKRTAWRQILRWIESQLALVDLDMVEMGEVFLPYMMLSKTETLYQRLKANNMKLIEG